MRNKVVFFSSLSIILLILQGCPVILNQPEADLMIPEYLFTFSRYGSLPPGHAFRVEPEFYETDLPIYLGMDFYPSGTQNVDSYLAAKRNEFYSLEREDSRYGKVIFFWGSSGSSPPPWVDPQNWGDSLLSPLRKNELVTVYRYICNDGTLTAPVTETGLKVEIVVRGNQVLDEQVIKETTEIPAGDCRIVSFDVAFRQFGDYGFIFNLDNKNQITESNKANNIYEDQIRYNLSPVENDKTRAQESWPCGTQTVQESHLLETFLKDVDGSTVASMKINQKQVDCTEGAGKWINSLTVENLTDKKASFDYYLYWFADLRNTNTSMSGWAYEGAVAELAPRGSIELGVINDYVRGDIINGDLGVIPLGDIILE